MKILSLETLTEFVATWLASAADEECIEKYEARELAGAPEQLLAAYHAVTKMEEHIADLGVAQAAQRLYACHQANTTGSIWQGDPFEWVVLVMGEPLTQLPAKVALIAAELERQVLEIAPPLDHDGATDIIVEVASQVSSVSAGAIGSIYEKLSRA